MTDVKKVASPLAGASQSKDTEDLAVSAVSVTPSLEHDASVLLTVIMTVPS